MGAMATPMRYRLAPLILRGNCHDVVRRFCIGIRGTRTAKNTPAESESPDPRSLYSNPRDTQSPAADGWQTQTDVSHTPLAFVLRWDWVASGERTSSGKAGGCGLELNPAKFTSLDATGLKSSESRRLWADLNL